MQTDVLVLEAGLAALPGVGGGYQLQDVGDHVVEADQIGAEPREARVTAEPGSLRTGVAQGPPHRGLHRRLEIEMPLDQVESLAIAVAAGSDRRAVEPP